MQRLKWLFNINYSVRNSRLITHALAYSFIAIQILVLITNYPAIYWDCGCLISDSGANEYFDSDEDEDKSDCDVVLVKDKVKVKTTDFGKIATAIGNFQNKGIRILPPDINKSSYTFTPNAETNSISYGLRGITRVSNDMVHTIIDGRPYTSLQDFQERLHLTKLPMLNLIKSGAFDNLEERPREEILHNYLLSVSDQKNRVTLQNMNMLSERNLIPKEMEFYKKLFSFNKFLKKNKDGIYYNLNEAALGFIEQHFDLDITENGNQIRQVEWDKLYKKTMKVMSDYLKAHQQEMLDKLNNSLYMETAEKYADGNISKWEMESLSFYYHDHELAPYQYMFDDFAALPEEPVVERSFYMKGKPVNILKLDQIVGTVIDKDKIRNTITLLTPTGVVNVKIYKTQYAFYDRQISEKNDDGTKHVIEPSWFKRGTLLWIQGFRRGQDFIPRKYRSSYFQQVIRKISIIDGHLEFQDERREVN